MAADEPDFANYETSVTYVDSSLKDTLIEAMIDAYMRRAVPNVVDGSCKEGRFEIITPRPTINHQAKRLYVSYPGGHWTEDGGLIGGDPDLGFDYFDAVGQVYEPIKQSVDTYLTPMMEAPRPDDFDDQIAVLQHVIQHLSVTGEVRTTGSGPATTIEVGDELVPQYIAEIGNELSDLNGVAMVRLRQVYGADRISDVMTGQHALAVVAGVLVAGEAQVWARFHRDFHKLIDGAAKDFHAYSEGNEVSAGEIFDVVKSVADASGLLSIPKGVATVIGKATTLGGIVKGFLPPEPPPHDYSLDGSSYQALSDSFWQAVVDLITDVESTELAFADCASSAVETASQPAGKNRVITTSFDLKNPEEFLTAGADGIYKDSNGNTVDIVVTDDALRKISGRYEAIGDHCRGLATKIAGAPEQGVWSRDITGPHGLSHGHYASFSGLVDLVATLLTSNADEMHSVGERCLLILSDFKATDAAIEKDLDKEAKAVVELAKEDAEP
ncbi:hypothetical protein [Nocardioides sp. L-11A]|uniref:hypothetical protein n=1 Tax=Nocardioides sp. L-11A TaxID=3043848 RepID=UPI00249B38B0|nr:hypothetical protein QJ852_20220 [Nocardioides sp. L-11A]